jgi:glycosyltransferase involved in cell wall biosynthesis
MPKVSVIIPARQEEYLLPTVADVLKQATGDIEVIVVLDGWWPNPMLPDDKRVKVLHWGAAQGLRPSINAGMEMATGEFVMKLDAHCAVGHGFDEILAAACGPHDLVVPEKYSLLPETWARFRAPWHYFYLTWPWDETRSPWGMHEVAYEKVGIAPPACANHALPIDDILTFQGSAWLMRKSHWRWLGPMETDRYYFAHEAPELGLKTWLGEGEGRCRIVKSAWYAHLHKGKSHRRTFLRHKTQWNAAIAWSTTYWLSDTWPYRRHDFAWLYEKFGPLPGWPEGGAVEAKRRIRGC